ncbi:MAG: tetratricopeptide repeat protein [Elusimicrobia bacterium]|nr:tetratricopeptide repeat protein [Elusimicrobiota bacterium]
MNDRLLDRKAALLIVLASLAAYGPTLRIKEFFHDDQAWIVRNPLLHKGISAVPKILSSGYVEPVLGSASPVQEYRPLLVLSFLVQTATTGFAPAPMHAANLLLHILVCLLFWTALRRRTTLEAAAAAALVFALLPVHTEAVTIVSWRSEVMTAAFVLGAWLCLEDGRLAPGVALYGAGLLTKEPVILFPAFYALADWTFHGRKPWDRKARLAHASLLAATGAYLALRAAVLPRMMHGGFPYFHSRLSAALTLPRFAFAHYVWPSVTGTGMCSDYNRPLIPYASAAEPLSWLCLAAWGAILAATLYACLKRRSPWSFWLLGPCLFLLPTSHLVFPLDTIGADRFLYVPTLGLAAGFGGLFEIARKRHRTGALLAGSALLVWYLAATVRRNLSWSSAAGFYEEAVACNPVSAKARNGLAEALLVRGELAAGHAQLLKALELDGHMGAAYYNLGRLAWQNGDARASERFLRRALAEDAGDADAWVLLAVTLQAQGRKMEAVTCLEKALEINPDLALAHFNLGTLDLGLRKQAEGLSHLARFVELAPDDPDAAKVAEMLGSLHAPAR